MPWKERYTVSDERTLAAVEWPEGRRCALLVVVDLAPPSGPAGIGPGELASDEAEFGIHAGVPRLLDLFTRHDVRATFAVPAVVAEAFPNQVRSIVARGHEIAAHGERHEDVSGLDADEERRRIGHTTETLARVAGERPAGWFTLPRAQDAFAGGCISPHTLDLLIEAGYEYLGNGMADDIPHYWVTDFASRRHILTLPYYYHFDDQFFLMFPAPGQGSGLERPRTLQVNWTREFDAMSALGRCFAMTLHPGLIAWGARLAVLEETLAHVRGEATAWSATGRDCARYFRQRYPAATALRLAPGIWQDHAGSLS